ncbi:MAG: DUF1674 domain-containing protein [Mesorhizobium sp.]|nr:MAG: DUF1674 domain-containing protein [Mesorhizobium sp.]
MTELTNKTETAGDGDGPRKMLTPAASRALAEAEAKLPKEIGGRGGKEPGRYGDWEVKGLTSDF